ncbi:hypothetical protein ABEG18_13220 [Alsobacter sp. KACC 23698]|uniref:Uncharacterized protein n=1 Tax=Alsobacter sp. KACC 23698 TaxID=3149229 RepID=A0AAU7J8L5_9HYPH
MQTDAELREAVARKMTGEAGYKWDELTGGERRGMCLSADIAIRLVVARCAEVAVRIVPSARQRTSAEYHAGWSAALEAASAAIRALAPQEQSHD